MLQVTMYAKNQNFNLVALMLIIFDYKSVRLCSISGKISRSIFIISL